MYESLFYGHYFICTNFGHKDVDCRAYGRNFQEINAYVSPHNIEYYKFHNYGHIALDCRSMINPPMKKNIDIKNNKAWITKKRKEEQLNEK
jgi:hypothetical protein